MTLIFAAQHQVAEFLIEVTAIITKDQAGEALNQLRRVLLVSLAFHYQFFQPTGDDPWIVSQEQVVHSRTVQLAATGDCQMSATA